MADIATVLKKTIEGLPANTPAIREKVYAKARGTILAKLEERDPRPPQDAIDRQMLAVDKVIAAVEQDYVFREQVDDVFADPAGAKPDVRIEAPAIPASPAVDVTEAPVVEAARSSLQPEPVAPDPAETGDQADGPVEDDVFVETATQSRTSDDAFDKTPPGSVAAVDHETTVDAPSVDPVAASAEAGPASRRGLLWALVLLVAAGAGGYAAWLNQDAIKAMFAAGPEKTNMASGEKPAEPAATTPPAAKPAADAKPTPVAGDGAASQKFTQRLNSDGTETDNGAAGGVGEGLKEGTSVAQVTSPAETGQGSPQAETPAATEQKPAASIAVGQSAIFYEERTAAEQGTADKGSVVWSVVEESPGNDLPAEPAIRGEVSFPERGLSLRMTLRRNSDKTLPASHIIELVFSTGDNFSGGKINDVLRMTFKDTEQAAGRPLLGIPAKIADNFFLIALTAGKTEETTNTELLRSQEWIDIPILYQTGRRALITMEKGLPGDKAFEKALESWAAAKPAE